LDSGLLKEVFGIGLPASLMTVLSSASYLMYNKVLVGYGEIAVSASAVATRGGMLSDCFQTGMAVGVQPLVGYNYSSGNYKRMNGIIKFSFLATVLIGAVFFGGLTLFAPQFIRAFINNDEVVALGKNFLRIFILTTPISGIASTLQSVFQGMGKAKVSMLLGLGRQIFFLLVIFIGQKFGGLYGVISAQPISVFGSLLLALCMYGAIGRELKKKSLIQKNVVEEKAIVAS
jgi:Na+-driven multidrug efflux pump